MLLGIAAYAVGLVATLPASVAFPNRPSRSGVGGTVWSGEVGLSGQSVLRWHWAPLRSLASFAYAADWSASGAGTDLTGKALAGFGGTRLSDVSGRGGPGLLMAIQPDLPFTCDFGSQIEMKSVAVGGAGQKLDGRVVSDAGSCRPKAGSIATPLPSLLLTAEKTGKATRIRIAPATQRLKTLVDASLDETGALDLTVTPEGAAMMPFLGVPGGTRIQGRM